MKMMVKSAMRCLNFFFSNLENFKAVIANLIQELCDTLSHGKGLFVSVTIRSLR